MAAKPSSCIHVSSPLGVALEQRVPLRALGLLLLLLLASRLALRRLRSLCLLASGSGRVTRSLARHGATAGTSARCWHGFSLRVGNSFGGLLSSRGFLGCCSPQPWGVHTDPRSPGKGINHFPFISQLGVRLPWAPKHPPRRAVRRRTCRQFAQGSWLALGKI